MVVVVVEIVVVSLQMVARKEPYSRLSIDSCLLHKKSPVRSSVVIYCIYVYIYIYICRSFPEIKPQARNFSLQYQSAHPQMKHTRYLKREFLGSTATRSSGFFPLSRGP